MHKYSQGADSKIFISIDGPIDNNDRKNQKIFIIKKINLNLDIKINF